MKSFQIQKLPTNSTRSGDRSGLCPTLTERGGFSTASASSGETHGARAAGAMQPEGVLNEDFRMLDLLSPDNSSSDIWITNTTYIYECFNSVVAILR